MTNKYMVQVIGRAPKSLMISVTMGHWWREARGFQTPLFLHLASALWGGRCERHNMRLALVPAA
jgi:hypothetical protein